jgi:hypothetical protein
MTKRLIAIAGAVALATAMLPGTVASDSSREDVYFGTVCDGTKDYVFLVPIDLVSANGQSEYFPYPSYVARNGGSPGGLSCRNVVVFGDPFTPPD